MPLSCGARLAQEKMKEQGRDAGIGDHGLGLGLLHRGAGFAKLFDHQSRSADESDPTAEGR